ncbi:MAG: hypothetical protein ACKO23_07730 [Gemmataceae bacterium]
MLPPRKVRLYRRQEHYVLQWWDPAAKGNLSDRVDGDLLSALMRARQIEERLSHLRRSGLGHRKLNHEELVSGFVGDLRKRADAGSLMPGTVARFRSALGYYLRFAEHTEVRRTFPHAGGINREFALGLASFLKGCQISPNGHPNTPTRPLRGQAFILDTVRAMFQWAADPDRGNLLPEGFRNPFLGQGAKNSLFLGDPLAEPEISLDMAIDFVNLCDLYQLRLFVPLLLFGMRASEPGFLFAEHAENGWLRVPCLPELAYQTKGKRDKRFPLLEILQPFWEYLRQEHKAGLLYRRRAVLEGQEKAPWGEASYQNLVSEFNRRCAQGKVCSAMERLHVRDQLLQEAGQVNYDRIKREFRTLARKLGWSTEATLKDFRHLFCTMLGNASIPEHYRRYLMGHAPGKAAVVAYTHLSQLQGHFDSALQKEWQPLLQAILARLSTLQDSGKTPTVAGHQKGRGENQ